MAYIVDASTLRNHRPVQRLFEPVAPATAEQVDPGTPALVPTIRTGQSGDPRIAAYRTCGCLSAQCRLLAPPADTLLRVSWALRGLLLGVVLLGICGFILGLIGDARGWWNELGFVSNVLAGATGAAFGIPFAVLVIQRVVQANESRANRERLQRRIGHEVRAIEEDLDHDGAALLRLTHYAGTTSTLAALRIRLDQFIADRGAEQTVLPSDLQQLVERFVAELRPEIARILEDPEDSVVDGIGRAARIRRAKNRWRSVLEDLLPQLGDPWLSVTTEEVHTVDSYIEALSSGKDPEITDPVAPVIELAGALRDLTTYWTMRRILRDGVYRPEELRQSVEAIHLAFSRLNRRELAESSYHHYECKAALRGMNLKIDPVSDHGSGGFVLG